MATIPLGNFGQSIIQPAPIPRVNAADAELPLLDAVGKAAGGLRDAAIGRIASDFAFDQEERKKRESNDAADAAMRFELDSKTKARELGALVRSGQIDPDAAAELWKDESSRMREVTVGKLPNSDFAAAAARHADQVGFQAGEHVLLSIEGAKQQRVGAQAASTLDTLGKLAVLPGEDLAATFEKADKLYPAMAQRAGVTPAQAEKTLQDWKDKTRFDRARLDLETVRHDMDGVDKFLARMGEGGDLSGTLDPDRRVALTREAEGAKWQLQQAAQHAVDKREKVAERALTAVSRQIEAAVPLTASAWEQLRETVKGTSFAEDFNGLVVQERDVQRVLRMPIGQQEQYLQTREAQLAQEGGTMADKANLQRVRTALDGNRKELEQAPLLAAQRLVGHKVEPLDLAGLLQPGGAHRAASIFADRASTLQAMAQQFGTRVGRQPLLPQEQVVLTRLIDAASPSEATQLFGALRAAIDDDGTYQAAMQQIAPDSPVRARAGLLAAAGKRITLETNLVADDLRVPSAKVAQTMLAGEAILNKTRGQKAEDGQARSLFAPGREAFAGTFADAVGDLYRGRPGAQEGDLQAAYAWYVGRAAELGRTASTSSDIDAKLAKQAVAATLGTVVNINGQGSVKAPLGMNADEFQAKVREQFSEQAKAHGLPPAQAAMFDHFGLIGYRRDGQYVLTLGGVPVVDPKRGTPVVIDLDPPPLAGSRFRSGVELIPTDRPSNSVPDGQGGAR